jgi:hypothetical protein
MDEEEPLDEHVAQRRQFDAGFGQGTGVLDGQASGERVRERSNQAGPRFLDFSRCSAPSCAQEEKARPLAPRNWRGTCIEPLAASRSRPRATARPDQAKQIAPSPDQNNPLPFLRRGWWHVLGIEAVDQIVREGEGSPADVK